MAIKKNKRKKIKSVARESESILENSISELRRLFPEDVAESSKIDFDKLRRTMGEEIDGSPGLYSFSWTGKREATFPLFSLTR